MKKKWLLCSYGIVFLMGFLPWNTIGGNGYGLPQYLTSPGEGGLDGLANGTPFFVWAVLVLGTYIIYPILMVRIVRGLPIGRLEAVSAYLALSMTILFYCCLYIICMATSVGFRIAPWIILRSALALGIYLWHRFRFDEVVQEKRKKSVRQKKRRPSAVFHLCTAVAFTMNLFLLPWGDVGPHTYTAFGMLTAIRQAGSVRAWVEVLGLTLHNDALANLTISSGMLYTLMILAVLMLVHAGCELMRRHYYGIGIAIYSLGFLYICIYMMFPSYLPACGLELGMLLILLDALLGKYIDERKALRRAAIESRTRAEAIRAEKKRREYFPGHYDREFFTVIRKNFLYNRNSYLLFILGAGGIVTVLYALVGILSHYRELPAGEESYYTRCLTDMMMQILPVIAAAAVLILALILTHYVRTRMHNYSVFHVLGIRMSTLRIIIATEYFACILIALIAGTLIGHVLSLHYPHPFGFTFGLTTLIYLVIVLIATLINYHLFEYQNIMDLTAQNENERRPVNVLPLWIGIGLYMTVTACRNYGSLRYSESFHQAVLVCAGVFLVYFAGLAWYVNGYERKAVDRGDMLLRLMPWRRRFRSQFRLIYLLFVFHFLALAVYLPQLASIAAAPGAEELYPYDYVCMASDDDRTIFERIEQKGADILEIPMLRATTPLGAPLTWEQVFNNPYMSVMSPQGQHVAISETSYRILKEAQGEKVEMQNLRGKDVHVVFQQDLSVKAHPLEWYMRSSNRFRLGRPLEYYEPMARNRIYPSHHATFERTILTGMLRNGQMENLIVLSDDYFEQVRSGAVQSPAETVEGPTCLYLIRRADAPAAEVESLLETFEEGHVSEQKYDATILNCYSGSTGAAEAEAGRNFSRIANLFAVLGILVSGVFLFYIKYGLERDERAAEFRLYYQLGMPGHRQRSLLRREMGRILLASYGTAALLSVPFVRALTDLRSITGAELSSFYQALLLYVVAYTVLFVTGVLFYQRRYIREFCN